MKRPALKLVEESSFSVHQGEYWINQPSNEHSIHGLLAFPPRVSASAASFILDKYTNNNSVLLDPFAYDGRIMNEAILLGRKIVGFEQDKLLAKIISSKLYPVDIAEVTLFLQNINLNLPINAELYNQDFSEFYSLDTFRELINLKRSLSSMSGQTASFIELVTLSILHGDAAGYLSVYSDPVKSLTKDEQCALNDKRSQTPEYRSVISRIIRKTAMMLRDCSFPSRGDYSKLFQSDPRSMTQVKTGTVDLVLSAPPSPFDSIYSRPLMLESWFSGIGNGYISRSFNHDSYVDFMNEVLFESARVVKSGGRLCFFVNDQLIGKDTLTDIISTIVDQDLYKYWQSECHYINEGGPRKVIDGVQVRRTLNNLPDKVIVLKRR